MDGSWWRVLTKHGPLEEAMANHSSIFAVVNHPMNSIKRQKDMTLKDELHRPVGAQYATGEEWRNNSRNNEETKPKQNTTQLRISLLMEVKSDAVKNNIAYQPGKLGPSIKVSWNWSNRRRQE